MSLNGQKLDKSYLNVLVLGAGAWGLTLANLLAEKEHHCSVWDIDATKIAALDKTRFSGRPLDMKLNESICFVTEFAKAFSMADVIVSVVPTFAVRDICRTIAGFGGGLGDKLFVSCSKGIEEGSLKLPVQIFEEYFGQDAVRQYVALSGPTHAEEVSRKIPTLIVAASWDVRAGLIAQSLFMTPELRVYTQDDVLGVETGAAIKNVIAIAAGMCDGLCYGDNTKAALITRALAEMGRAVAVLGGRQETLSGLAGLGDLVVTTMSRHSRNRMFGQLLAEGRSTDQALKEVGAVVEGYRTAHSAYELSQKLSVDMPIVATVYKACYEGIDLRQAAMSLLTRDPKPEKY